ncbi:MAG: ABC transporter permease [Spirochaetales bacterium]|nr:ABC transporter permease [Spirochaetales bacterium]
MPGDPVYAMLGGDITQEQYDMAYKEMNLDKPIYLRYVNWCADLIKGDFGKSYKYRMPVIDLIKTRLPVTMYLGGLSIIISTAVGILFGILAATKRGKILDTVITFLANLGAVMPLFWLAVLGMSLFAMHLKWLPSYGFTFPTEDFVKSVRQTILPVIALSVGAIASTTRQMRSSMLEVIQQDYIRTARAKGLKESRVISKHALKNALIPIVTLTGMSFRNVVSGSASIEIIFSIAGTGQLLVTSVLSKDVATTQACILIVAIVVSIANLIVDISYGYLDPRIRIQ